jgi:hypothetical protein
MRQALHIFNKDVRYLWKEIGLLLTLAAMLGWAEIHSPMAGLAELLWTVAAIYAIARVVHAEAIPGHNQFWITRPYRWKSLLGAKLLFILLFVNLPMAAAQGYMIAAANFPVAVSLPGLIWSQILFLICLSLPVAALAAITAGIASFLLSEFVVLAVGFICSSAMIRVLGGPLAFLSPAAGPAAVEWVRESLALAIFAGVTAFVLYAQYKNRRTSFSRTWALSGAVVTVAVFLYMPWPIALGVQPRLSKQPFDGSSLRVALDSIQRSAFPNPGRDKVPQVEVILPIAVSGTRDGAELQADALSVTIQGADGRAWSSRLTNLNVQPGGMGVTIVNAYLLVDPSFFKDESARAVTVRGGLYLTLFGNTQVRTISLQGEPVNVMDGLQCGTGLLNQLYCRSVFRWPRRRVSAQMGKAGMEAFTWSVSYSPFPATIGFSPFEQHWVSTSKSATEATIVTTEPLSFFRRDFEIRDVHLTDFTREAKRKTICPGIHCPVPAWQ